MTLITDLTINGDATWGSNNYQVLRLDGANTFGGFVRVGGGVLAFLAFAAFWATSGELRAKRQRRKTRRMVRERDEDGDVAPSNSAPLPLCTSAAEKNVQDAWFCRRGAEEQRCISLNGCP